MRIYLPYKKDKLMVEIPDKNILGIVEPKEVKGSAKENVLKKAVENPTKAMSLSNFLRKHNKILFLINDGQRPTPTKKILDTIYPIMKPYMNKIEFMIATGSHRVPTEEEFNNFSIEVGKRKVLKSMIDTYTERNKSTSNIKQELLIFVKQYILSNPQRVKELVVSAD